MDEINTVLLRLYEATQSTSVQEFPEKVFTLIKNLIKFDSAGLCDFMQTPQSAIILASAIPHNVSTEEKLRIRSEYIGNEKIVDQNALFTDDPSLAKAFHRKNTAVSLSVLKNSQVKANVAAYGIKTGCLQTMAMVHESASPTSFQTLSLWRAKADADYTADEEAIANLVLPHVFRAFSIHRQIHERDHRDATDKTTATAMCTLSGRISFIDESAVYYLLSEFHDWLPPFLPARLLEKLRSTSEKIYIGAQYTVAAQRKQDTLFLIFRPTTSFENLSPTEIVIAEMLARNETYKSIAQRLGTQPATVRNQAHSIYMKFGISGKADLAKILKNTSH